MEVPDDLAVVSEVLMVLICHSMKPLDLEYRGEDIMWSMPGDERKWGKGSEENGDPLSVKKASRHAILGEKVL